VHGSEESGEIEWLALNLATTNPWMKGFLFTYLMTIGGTVIAPFRPFWGLLVYLAFAILKPDILWDFSVPKGYYSRIVMISVLIGWALSGFGHWRFGRARLLVVALFGYMIASCVSAYAAADQQLAWDQTQATAKTLLPVLVGLTLLDSTERLRQVAWVIVLSQGFLAYEFNRSYYDGYNRLVMNGFAGMDEKTVAIGMVVGASVAVFLGLSSKRWWQQALALALAIPMMHVPLFVFSRGGMMALLVSGAVAFWFIPKRPMHLGVVVVAILLGFRLAGPEVRAKFMSSFSEEEQGRGASGGSRLVLWGQAWETLTARPLIGVGPRHWGRWAQSHYEWRGEKEAHNTWLQAGAELGFPGLIALLLIFVSPLFLLLPVARADPRLTGADGDLARMVVCGLAGFFVASQFITVYGVELPYFVAMMGGGLLRVRSTALVQDAASVGATSPASAAAGSPAINGQAPGALGVVARRSLIT